MKILIAATLSLFITHKSIASTCLNFYKEKVDNQKISLFKQKEENKKRKLTHYGQSVGAGGVFTLAATTGVVAYGLTSVTPVGWVLLAITPLSLAVTSSYNEVKVGPYRKAAKLIEQAYQLEQDPSQKPKGLLKRVFKSIPKEKNVSIMDLVNSIIQGDRSGELCSDAMGYKSIRNSYIN